MNDEGPVKRHASTDKRQNVRKRNEKEPRFSQRMTNDDWRSSVDEIDG